MDHFEMVEKLRAKANVSYEEAKAALEASDWDILDALVLLESEGKVKDSEPAKEYTTQEKKEEAWSTKFADAGKGGFADGLEKMWAWIKQAFQKGNHNQFVINRRNDELIAMPITVMAILMICFWPFSMIVLFVGLFLGCRYNFRGPDVGGRVNSMMDKAQEKAAQAVEIHLNDNEKKVE